MRHIITARPLRPARHLTRPNSRARDGVGLHVLVGVGVDVNVDLWVRHLVHAGDGSEVSGRWDGGAGTGDGQVRTLWVPDHVCQ